MRVALTRGAIAASMVLVVAGCSTMSWPSFKNPFARNRSADPGVSTTALSNAPSAPPVSGVAAAPPNVTMPVSAQHDASNLPTYPGTSYPVTPYPATPTAANLAANVPTYGAAPNAAGGSMPASSVPQQADPVAAARPPVTPGMAPQGAPAYGAPAYNAPAYGAAAPSYAGGAGGYGAPAQSAPAQGAPYSPPIQDPNYVAAQPTQPYTPPAQGAPYDPSAPQAGAYNAAAPQGTYTR